ncbi:hypothetical protein AK812_SmicGene34331 [Symbiodinium microadriaticum]|uniref:Uncharacterized protein n=1 Tax=Symbiodinium microadriaticum TaxID=2951 RepID=A0A1Q9CPG1_SYMMI|nr:hypothetical protein AK812_SmicGene34331 [Symbiodinium microadriaticum]
MVMRALTVGSSWELWETLSWELSVAALAAGCGSFHRLAPCAVYFSEAKVRQLAASRPGLSGDYPLPLPTPQDTDFAPLLDGNEQWRAELDCWRALLAPFPWTNARASVMSRSSSPGVLSSELLSALPVARWRLSEVRSFEILRCLGADLLDNDTKGSVARLQRHGEKLACWASTEITENTLLAYRQSVGRKESDVVSLKPAEAAEEAAQARGALDAAAKLGFVPSALRGRVPTLALVRLAASRPECILLQVDEAALPPESWWQAGQALARQLVGPKQPDPAGGSPSMQLLRDLETHPSAQLVLNNMALSELLQVMSRILEAHRMVHGEKELPHEALRRWSSRTAAAAVPPRELASPAGRTMRRDLQISTNPWPPALCAR